MEIFETNKSLHCFFPDKKIQYNWMEFQDGLFFLNLENLLLVKWWVTLFLEIWFSFGILLLLLFDIF